MITIQLKRSGGQLGKTLQASRNVDLDEDGIIKKLKAAAPVNNPHARDDFSYTIILNNKETFPIDRALLKGKLQKIVADLEDNLKVDDN